MSDTQGTERPIGVVMNRRALLQAFATGAGALVGARLLAACGGEAVVPTAPPTKAATPTAAGAPAVAGGQVSVLWGKPTILQPIFSNTGSDQNAERAMFGTLVKMTDKLEPVPDLAEKVEASPDAKTYTFTLRKGLQWSDGKTLTARDVAFTIERAVDKRVGSFWRGRFLDIMGATEYGDQKAETITGVETPDDLTVKITLKAPDAAFLITLGDFSGLGILPAHALKDIPPDQMQKHPSALNPTITAGAFQFVQYAADQYLELKRNDAYAGTRAKLDRVFLKILASDAAIAQLEKGELDVMGNVPTTEVERLRKNPNLTLASVPSPSITRIAVNNEKPYLNDKRIRQAMLYAIDREGIVKEILRGEARIVNTGIIGPDWMGAIPGLNEYRYDPNKAKQLLKEANWDASRKLQFILTPDDKTANTFAPIVQQQFKEVGIQIDLLQVDGPEATNRYLRTFEYELYTFGGGVFRADPDNAAKFFATRNIAPAGANGLRYSNAQIDALFDQGKSFTDTAKRKEIYLQIAKILNEDVPMVYLWSPNAIFAYNKRLQGFKPPSYAGNTLWNVEEWSVAK